MHVHEHSLLPRLLLLNFAANIVTKAEEEPWNKDTCHGTTNEAYLAVKSQPQICYTRTQSIIVQDTAQPILGLIYCAQACTIAVHLRLLFLS